jgi:CheY-like chemotaxis protein
VTPTNRPLLVVDDNDDDATLALLVLSEESGQEIDRARDGEEACAYLFGGPDGGAPRPLPRMVLLDLHMPRLDGMEVLQRIRADERTRLVPVVMLTSSDAEDDIVRSYRLGVNGFVRKPVDHTQFRAALRAVGNYWLGCNETAPERVP